MQIVVREQGPPSRKKRGKGGATPNWEFRGKGWARLGQPPLGAPFTLRRLWLMGWRKPRLPLEAELRLRSRYRNCFFRQQKYHLRAHCVPAYSKAQRPDVRWTFAARPVESLLRHPGYSRSNARWLM